MSIIANVPSASSAIPAAVLLILIVELCERFCYYTIQGSQKSFMNQKLGYNNAEATTIALVWSTFCYVTCLGGGVLGDRFIGRYLTIAILATWYVGGCLLMSASTLPSVNSRGLFLLGSFLGVAVGTGGIKPLVCNFGADQVVLQSAKEKFFAYFYWMVNIGAAVALGGMTTIATDPKFNGMGYFYSYLAGTGGMALAVLFFLSGTPFFKKKFLHGSLAIFRPLFRAFGFSATRSSRGRVAVVGWALTVPFFGLVFWQAFASGDLQQSLSWVAFALSAVQLVCLVWAHADISFLQANPARTIEVAGPASAELSSRDVQLTFQTIPVLLVVNIVFNFAYSMMLGPFFNQSCQMDLRLGWPIPQLNGAVFNLADTAAIIVGIPITERCVFPLIQRLRGREIQTQEKLFIGFLFAFLAMVSAAVLELLRRSSSIIAPPGYDPSAADRFGGLMGPCEISGQQWCSNCAPQKEVVIDGKKTQVGIYMSSISGFWMLVPYAFIGMGEILINPVAYFYAYSLTPPKTQSVIQAINLIFQGAYPPALTGVFVSAFASAMPNNLNKGKLGGLHVGLEVFYYIGALFVVVGTPVLMWVTRRASMVVPGQDSQGGGEGDEHPSLSNPTSFQVRSEHGSFVIPKQEDDTALLPS